MKVSWKMRKQIEYVTFKVELEKKKKEYGLQC
jgi:hypothetical protein